MKVSDGGYLRKTLRHLLNTFGEDRVTEVLRDLVENPTERYLARHTVDCRPGSQGGCVGHE